jgi:hypothetical protein
VAAAVYLLLMRGASRTEPAGTLAGAALDR